MATTNLSPAQQEEKIEAYFALAPAFAQSICAQLRHIIGTADPELKPVLKWGAPVYEKPGPGMVCAIGVFKQHVNLTFFQGVLLEDTHHLFASSQDAKAMRSIKFTQADQVNKEQLVPYVKAAAQLPPGTAVKSAARDVIEIPEDLKQALSEGQQLEKFEQMAYTHRKEYVRWVNEAKKPETRDNRIMKTVERMAEGKNFS